MPKEFIQFLNEIRVHVIIPKLRNVEDKSKSLITNLTLLLYHSRILLFPAEIDVPEQVYRDFWSRTFCGARNAEQSYEVRW